MPVGIIINALSVASGGVVGALFGHKLPTRINSELTKIFGVCSMGMGVSSIGLMKNMPAVIFAVIIGTAFGLAVNLGGIINHKDKDRQEKVLHRSKVLRPASAAERIDSDGDQGQSDGQYNRSRYNRREKFTQRLDKESENTLKKTAEN